MVARLADGRLLAPLLLLVVVLSMMYIHPSIPFANSGNCDPWYIFGMFYTFPSALHWFPTAYQVSRLTEILPGYFLTRLLPNITADYGLFLLEYSISIVLFYGAVRRLLTPQIAIFSSLFLALNPLMLGSYSATLDAPAIMCDIVNLYFVAAAMDCSRPRLRRALLFASGIAFALALDAYVAIAILALGNYVLFYTYIFARASKEPLERVRLILVSLLFAAGGAFATLLVLGFIVVAFHGRFDEAFIQFSYLLTIFANFHKVGSGGAVYWQSTWYEQGAITGMLALASATAILNLVRLRKANLENGDDFRKKLLAVSVGVLFVEAALLAANSAGFVLLQYDYYYVFFVPYLALVIFSPLVFITPLPGKTLPIFAIAFSAAGLVATSITNARLPGLFAGASQSQLSLMTVVFVIPIFAAVVWQKRQVALLTIVILGSLTVLVQRPVQIGITMWTETRAQEQMEAARYARIRQGLVYLHSLHFSSAPSVFWLDPNPDFGAELVAFPRSYLQCSFWSFPSHPAGAAPLSTGEDIVVVASLDHLLQRATAALADLKARAQLASRYEIDYGGVRYEILVLRITVPITSARSASYRSSVETRSSRDGSCHQQISARTTLVSGYD
jgi:hypothetical protein